MIIVVARGVFKWDNDTSAPVDQADVGKDCYMLDDEAVTTTAEGTAWAGQGPRRRPGRRGR